MGLFDSISRWLQSGKPPPEFTDIQSPIEARRRAEWSRRGVEVDEIVQKLITRVQELPPVKLVAAATLAVSVGWFAMPALHKLLRHPDSRVQDLAIKLIREIDLMVEPPVQFENPDPEVVRHAAKVFNHLACKALQAHGKAEEAIIYLDRSLTLVENDPVVLANKASAMGALGRYDEAVAYLDLAIARDRSNQNLLLARANYLSLNGKLEQALACYEALVAAGFEGAAQGVDRSRQLLRERAKRN